jgi:DNA invertase Pin-like site-specific DNA recombinase
MANRTAKAKQAISATEQVAHATTGAMVGYARTSTVEQEAGLDAQVRDLRAAGATKLFTEQRSSIGDRPRLAACLDYLREGDTLIVTKPDRLARSTAHLLSIVEDLGKRGVGVVLLSMGGQRIDTRSATGKLMLTMMAAVAEFERELMLERQREGIAKAKAEGAYKGRAPTVARQADEMRKMLAAGMKPAEVARTLGVARSSVYRIALPSTEQKVDV